MLPPEAPGRGRRPGAAYAAAIFDMDGLLLDSERPIRDAWLQAAHESGIPLSEAAYLNVVGANEADSRTALSALLGGEAAYRRVRARADALVRAYEAQPGYAAKAGAGAILELLVARGIVCGVASSTHRPEVHRRLGAAGLRGFFRSISGGDEVARGKPHPDLYLLAAGRLQVPPAACLAFEDTERGAHSALAAGMAVVIVPDLKRPGPATGAACLVVLESLADALPHCARWFGGE